jgi:hypothetical protein
MDTFPKEVVFSLGLVIPSEIKPISFTECSLRMKLGLTTRGLASGVAFA